MFHTEAGRDPVVGGVVPIPSDVQRVGSRSERSKLFLKNLGLVPIRDAGGRTYYAQGKNSIKGRLVPVRQTSRGAIQIKGRRRTFVLDPAHHRVGIWAVYQRTGKHRDDIQLIYFGARRAVIPARLQFEQGGKAIAARELLPRFRQEFLNAMRTAR